MKTWRQLICQPRCFVNGIVATNLLAISFTSLMLHSRLPPFPLSLTTTKFSHAVNNTHEQFEETSDSSSCLSTATYTKSSANQDSCSAAAVVGSTATQARSAARVPP